MEFPLETSIIQLGLKLGIFLLLERNTGSLFLMQLMSAQSI